MPEDLTLLERLNDTINAQAEQIDTLKREIEDYENARSWTEHDVIDDDDLPVPRLEIRLREVAVRGYTTEALYSLVYRHTTGHIERVPMGSTLSSAPLHEDWIPFRDGVHVRNDAMQLNLPAIRVRADGSVECLWRPGEPEITKAGFDAKCAQERRADRQRSMGWLARHKGE